MKMAKVVGTGSYLPDRIVTNAEVAPRINSSAEWIYSHTGITCRRIRAKVQLRWVRKRVAGRLNRLG